MEPQFLKTALGFVKHLPVYNAGKRGLPCTPVEYAGGVGRILQNLTNGLGLPVAVPALGMNVKLVEFMGDLFRRVAMNEEGKDIPDDTGLPLVQRDARFFCNIAVGSLKAHVAPPYGGLYGG
jgi:hypothetical protein